MSGIKPVWLTMICHKLRKSIVVRAKVGHASKNLRACSKVAVKPEVVSFITCTVQSLQVYKLPSSVVPFKDSLNALPFLSLRNVSTLTALLFGKLTDILHDKDVWFMVYLLARPSTPLSPILDIFKAGISVTELFQAGVSGIKG